MRQEGDPLPLQRRKMSAKSFFMCLFQKKEEKMRLMSFRPPMQHFFSVVWIFYYSFFFLLFLTVGFVFCNVCALAYRLQL